MAWHAMTCYVDFGCKERREGGDEVAMEYMEYVIIPTTKKLLDSFFASSSVWSWWQGRGNRVVPPKLTYLALFFFLSTST